MDFKVAVAAVAVLFSGFLFYQNQKRSDMLMEMTQKYQASVEQAKNAGAAAIMTDEALMDVIRAQVKNEMAANPVDCSGPKFSTSDAAKYLDVAQRLHVLEKKFNKAASLVLKENEKGAVQEKLTSKASQLKDKIVSLCRK